MELIANILIYIAGILWGMELIPQLYKTIKTKQVKDLSLLFFIMCFIAYIIYAIGNLILANYNIIISLIPSLLCNFIMICIIYKYKK